MGTSVVMDRCLRARKARRTGELRLSSVILLLHNRYRTLGGEERVVEELLRILPEELGEEVLLLERGSAELSSGHAAFGMLRRARSGRGR